MTCKVRNKEINSQCAELLVRPLYIINNDKCLISVPFPLFDQKYFVA